MNIMIIAIVVIIGPIEFSTRDEKKNAITVTTDILTIAKPYANKNLHKTSLLAKTTIALL